MNIFGSFSFGSLLKTFLPGVVLFAALTIVLEELKLLHFFNTAISSDAITLLTVVIGSLILGLTSNIIIFMGPYDWIVRDRHEELHKGIHNLRAYLKVKICSHYFKLAGLEEPSNLLSETIDKIKLSSLLNKNEHNSFPSIKDNNDYNLIKDYINNLDVESILMMRGDLKKFYSLREAYWYYLEFQINMAFGVTMFCLSLLLWVANSSEQIIEDYKWLILIMILIFTVFWDLLMIQAAKKNYERHFRKMTSLLLAVFVDGFSSESTKIPSDNYKFET